MVVGGWVVLVVVVGGCHPRHPRRPSHTHTPLSGLRLGRVSRKEMGVVRGLAPTYLICEIIKHQTTNSSGRSEGRQELRPREEQGGRKQVESVPEHRVGATLTPRLIIDVRPKRG